MEIAATVLAELSARDREALVRFYLSERARDEICAELNMTRAEFDALKAHARARFWSLRQR